MRPSLVAHAPTRLDFGGGWTDVPPYPEERGGFVCNLAIERRATVRLSAIHDNDSESINHSALVRAACSAARVEGVRIELSSDFPMGAGLGGSSAAGVALAAVLSRWTNVLRTHCELAEWSRAVEVLGLQMAGGRQDHYAAAFGGALALSFGNEVHAQPIPLSAETTTALEQQCLLIYTGESRISGETITAVLDAYSSRTPRVIDALERMKALALQMAQSLRDGNVRELGALIDEHWQHQRALHPRITTPRIDAISAAAEKAGALGMKALGASGGGCVVVITPADRADQVAAAVAPFGDRLDWRVAHTGVDVREELPLPKARA